MPVPPEMMGQRLCSVDIGSTSVKALVVEAEAGGLRILGEDKRRTMLGAAVLEWQEKPKHSKKKKGDEENAPPENLLQDPRVQAALQNLPGLVHFAQGREQSAVHIRAVATSPVRGMPSGKKGDRVQEKFLASAARALGIPEVRLLTGKEEAELIFHGVVAGDSQQGKILTVDAGGLSVDCAWGNHGKLRGSKSTPLGWIALGRKHLASPFPTKPKTAEKLLRAVRQDVRDAMKKVPLRHRNLIGVGGVFTTLAAVLRKRHAGQQPDQVNGTRITKEDLRWVLGECAGKRVSELQKHFHLQGTRADILVPGTMLALALLQETRQDHLTVSDRNLRCAVLTDWMTEGRAATTGNFRRTSAPAK